MRERFEQIYATNEWGKGSGEGSMPEHTQGYVEFLQGFIRSHNIRSVLDLGCGDWQFSRFIDWSGVNYLGLDIVASVIAENTKAFAKPNIHFQLYDGDPTSIPDGELLIIKDVLQHWSNAAIHRLLPELRRFRFVLLTNCVDPLKPTVNTDILDGDFRYLDLRLSPFNLDAQEVYSFTHQRSLLNRLTGKPRWLKRVMVLENR